MEFLIWVIGPPIAVVLVFGPMIYALDRDVREVVNGLFTHKSKPQPEPHPTKYQTEPPTLAMEIHRGKHAVILKTRNDRTVVRQEDMMALSDELRKYHTTISTLNEIIGMDDIKAEETTQNEPPEPNALPERVDVKGWDGETLVPGISAMDADDRLREIFKTMASVTPNSGVELDHSERGSINNDLPKGPGENMRGYADTARALYDSMKGLSSANPNSGYVDFLANSFSDMARPEYERYLVEAHIAKKFPAIPYKDRNEMAKAYITDCRRSGVDPVQGIQGKV